MLSSSIFFRFFFRILITLNLVYSFSAMAEDEFAVYFSPDQSHREIIDGISAAKKSVQMVIFHVDDPAVLKAMVAAHLRGVKVQVIMDRLNLLLPTYGNAKKLLEKAGIEVFTSTRGFRITHQKTMLVDGDVAYVTTMNLGKSGVNNTRDWGVITHDPGVISEMEEVFKADVENAQKNSDLTPKLVDQHLLWSPINAESKLIGLINSARVSIISTVENLGNKNIQNAFVAAAARGVKVRIISPLCDISLNPHQNVGFSKEMSGGGVEARLMPSPASAIQPYMHAKMIVVDSLNAYVGSVNFSDNSLYNSREAGIIFSQTAGITKMETEFEKDWAHTVSPTQTLPSCKGSN